MWLPNNNQNWHRKEGEMAYEVKPGEGSAWPNDKKTEDWHAEFRGKVMLPDGKTHWLDVHPKKASDGRVWYKIKVGKEVVSNSAPAYSAAHKPFAQSEHDRAKSNGFAPITELDDDIPF
jgi:hypothetical protein